MDKLFHAGDVLKEIWDSPDPCRVRCQAFVCVFLGDVFFNPGPLSYFLKTEILICRFVLTMLVDKIRDDVGNAVIEAFIHNFFQHGS